MDGIRLCLLFLHAGCMAVFVDSCSTDGESFHEFDVEDESHPSIYDDLTRSEITAVINYMYDREEFNIIDGQTVLAQGLLNCTSIYHIEALPVPKAEALNYLDHNGSKPLRFALVILLRGDLDPPVIEEYKVGALPDIQGYEKLSRTGKQAPIEYIKRNYVGPADFTAMESLAKRELSKIDDILEAVTGYRMNACGNRCLKWLPGIPGEFKARDRSMWIFLVRDVEGHYLHPIGLQFRITFPNSHDPRDFSVNIVWFRGETFRDFEHMLSTFRVPDDVKSVHMKDDVDLFSSLHHRGDPLSATKRRGPSSALLDGRRYKVIGHHVEWQGWSFDFNLRSIIGIQVHDLQFKGERIAYELSLSELGIIYSGASPSPIHTAYIDSAWYLGKETLQLFPNMDCPDHASFFDFAHFMNFQAVVFPSSVCLFEHQKSIPLRRHAEPDHVGSFKYAHGMPGNVLVLRSIMTVENYEYFLDHVFYQNGVVEVSVSLSGYLLTTYYTGTPIDDRYGYQIHPEVLGQIHNHLIHFKVDLDILDSANRFETLDVDVQRTADPARPSEEIYAQVFQKHLRRTEKDALYEYNFNTPKYLVFHNDKHRNHVGNPRGYRLLTQGMTKQLIPKDWAIEKGFSWARYQVSVTKHKDSESRGSSIYNAADLNEPFVNFEDFIADDESIVDEDLVAWVSLGSLHIPHSEDIPIVQTPAMTLSYFLLPYNFFNGDPSLASRDNIRVNKDANQNPDIILASGDTCTSGTAWTNVPTDFVIILINVICVHHISNYY